MLLNWDASSAPVTIFLDKYYEGTKYLCWHILIEKIFPNQKLLNFCEIAVLWAANEISSFGRLTQSLIFNEWPNLVPRVFSPLAKREEPGYEVASDRVKMALGTRMHSPSLDSYQHYTFP
jgi:hypothetical protein